MFFKRVFLLLSIISIHLGLAAPTQRALPPEVIDENPDYFILRDHQKARYFYLVPKRLVLRENKIQSFGDQKYGCEAVSQYNETQKKLVQTKKEHAEASLNRAKLVNNLLKHSSNLEVTLSESLVKRLSLEEELKALELPSDRKKGIQEELLNIEKNALLLEKQLSRIQSIQQNAENEQKLLLDQVTKLEASLNSFEEKVMLPAGRIRVRLRSPEIDFKRTESLKHFGFKSADLVTVVPIVGLSYYPGEQESVDFLERRSRETSVGNFSPDWSPKSFSANDGDFGTSELPVGIDERPFPNEIVFEQLISLYSYCAIQSSKISASDPIVPIKVNIQVAQWTDKKTDARNDAEVISHTHSLNENGWAKLQRLPTQKSNTPQFQTDAGDPRHFGPNGIFDKKSYGFTFLRGNHRK